MKVNTRLTGVAGAILVFCRLSDPAFAASSDEASDNGPWSATLYSGPAANNFASQIFFHQQFDPNDTIIGLAADRRIFRLGSGFTFEGEAQLSQFVGSHTYTVCSVGLGFRYTFAWRQGLPASIAAYTGPSYTNNPPLNGTGPNDTPITFAGVKTLNYVGAELAFAIPSQEKHWDAVLRLFHRSGAFGLYSNSADAGTAVGVGIRTRF